MAVALHCPVHVPLMGPAMESRSTLSHMLLRVHRRIYVYILACLIAGRYGAQQGPCVEPLDSHLKAPEHHAAISPDGHGINTLGVAKAHCNDSFTRVSKDCPYSSDPTIHARPGIGMNRSEGTGGEGKAKVCC